MPQVQRPKIRILPEPKARLVSASECFSPANISFSSSCYSVPSISSDDLRVARVHGLVCSSSACFATTSCEGGGLLRLLLSPDAAITVHVPQLEVFVLYLFILQLPEFPSLSSVYAPVRPVARDVHFAALRRNVTVPLNIFRLESWTRRLRRAAPQRAWRWP